MPVIVKVEYHCGGCDAVATAPGQTIRREFESFSGHAYGVGTHVLKPSIDGVVTSAAPEGWMPFDPYTQCTYCPACWASIDAGETEAMVKVTPQ
jgi:hypothetical protein